MSQEFADVVQRYLRPSIRLTHRETGKRIWTAIHVQMSSKLQRQHCRWHGYLQMMISGLIKQKFGTVSCVKFSDLFSLAQRNFINNTLKDIDYSKSVYLEMGLLDEHDEKMRLYFLNNEKSLTADEKTHFILLNKMIFHRVCDLAENGSDTKDVIETHDVQSYVGTPDDEVQSPIYLNNDSLEHKLSQAVAFSVDAEGMCRWEGSPTLCDGGQ